MPSTPGPIDISHTVAVCEARRALRDMRAWLRDRWPRHRFVYTWVIRLPDGRVFSVADMPYSDRTVCYWHLDATDREVEWKWQADFVRGDLEVARLYFDLTVRLLCP